MRYVAYCGLLCNECEIYIATKNNNEHAKEQLAIKCSSNDYSFSKEDMNCDGCFSEKAKMSKMCSVCEIKACAESKNVINNCAYCNDYPCSLITKYCSTENKARLNLIKDSLKKHEAR